MSQFSASKARAAGKIAGAALLLTLLGGCAAIYDDTKGWANRLEASILKTAHEIGEPQQQESATGGPGEMAPPPAVPLEPVDTAALAPLEAQPSRTPEAQPSRTPAPLAAATAPEGAMAAASDALLAGEAETPAKPAEPAAAPEQAMATPTAPQPKPAVPATAGKAPEEPSEKAPEKSTEPAKDAAVQMVLHLSSLRSEEAAKREWSDLQRSFPAPLGQMEAEIQRTDLGDKGTFYRVLAGPLPSPDEARQVCSALKAKDTKQYCRVMPSEPKG
jgi:cell division septation protein DedD